MTRNLAVLEKAQLVVVRRGTDARKRIAELTPEGRRRIEAALADWQAVQTRIAESMSEDAADSLLAIAWSQDEAEEKQAHETTRRK